MICDVLDEREISIIHNGGGSDGNNCDGKQGDYYNSVINSKALN